MNTIDEILLERARAAAAERMREALQPMRDLINRHGAPLNGLAYSVNCKNRYFDPTPHCATVLLEMEEAMLPSMVAQEHRRIISEFINRVDRIERIERNLSVLTTPDEEK